MRRDEMRYMKGDERRGEGRKHTACQRADHPLNFSSRLIRRITRMAREVGWTRRNWPGALI